MKHILFEENPHNQYKTAILIKESAFYQKQLNETYVRPLTAEGISRDSIIAFTLKYNGKKISVREGKAYLATLLKALDGLGTDTLFVADGEYFKMLTGAKKADPNLGYILDCKIKGYEHMKVIFTLNHQRLFHNPALQKQIDLSLKTLVAHHQNNHVVIGSNIINYSYYPSKVSAIRDFLNSLHRYPELTCDIETFSLKHYSAGLGTIGFAWDENNGGAFCIDRGNCRSDAIAIRALLKNFFETYQGKLIYHNAGFDVTVLIYQLWMDHILDQEGLLKGLHIMCENMEDTKIITYLATNSCAGNKLSLKDQAHEFAGNYAQSEIDDISKIDIPDLLEYNLVDCLSTWFVAKKHMPTMIADGQEELYRKIMLPSLKVIIQMQLTGMCLDMDKVLHAEKVLTDMRDKLLKQITSLHHITQLVYEMSQEKTQADYEKRKEDSKNPEKIKVIQRDVEFNPNSNPQLQRLLYTYMGLPIIDRTENKQPAVGAKTLKKLLKHTDNQGYKDVIQALHDFIKVEKILTSFIPAFKAAPKGPDGNHYLFGSFNLGGTVSGRLSSKNPNLQQIPSGSTHAKLIKECFISPEGALYLGSDFNALEDVVNTLLTRDPNKEKVLIQGFDGHCFRTYYYWPEMFPGLDPEDPKSINTIKKTHDSQRSASKPVSFALQYQGTWHTLVANCGFTPEEAMMIEGNYHTLYTVSNDWTQARIKEASEKGYATGAFGLRIRTPILAQTILGASNTPFEAGAESRTLGNALSGQSYGLLNCRAANEFMELVWNSPYAHKIRICAQIHDAIYMYIPNDIEVLHWVNENLIKCMAWQDLPELEHDEIKLGSELDIFYPNWANAITLPNGASKEEIIELCKPGEENAS